MWSKESWGLEEEEDDADANTVEGGTQGAKEVEGNISRALMVTTLALSKGVATMEP